MSRARRQSTSRAWALALASIGSSSSGLSCKAATNQTTPPPSTTTTATAAVAASAHASTAPATSATATPSAPVTTTPSSMPPAVTYGISTVFKGAPGAADILDSRQCRNIPRCFTATLVRDKRKPVVRIGLLLVPFAPGVMSPPVEWIEISEGDGAYFNAPVDLDVRSLAPGEESHTLAVLDEGAFLSLPEHAKVPSFVVGVTSKTGVGVANDMGVTQALFLVAHRGKGFHVVLSAPVRGRESSGRGFGPIRGIELLRGEAKLLDVRWMEHVTPGPDDKPFRPGPPLTVRYRFDGEKYVR